MEDDRSSEEYPPTPQEELRARRRLMRERRQWVQTQQNRDAARLARSAPSASKQAAFWKKFLTSTPGESTVPAVVVEDDTVQSRRVVWNFMQLPSCWRLIQVWQPIFFILL